jgi:hypothetical protein
LSNLFSLTGLTGFTGFLLMVRMTLSKPPSAFGGGRAFELFFRKSEKRNPVSPVNPVQPLFLDRTNRIYRFFAQASDDPEQASFASGRRLKALALSSGKGQENNPVNPVNPV